MPITGELLIGRSARRGTNGEIFGLDAASGEKLQPGFGGATLDDLEEAAALASAAFRPYRETSLEVRAKFLETIAQNILDIGDELIERAMAKAACRAAGSRASAAAPSGQLRLFADVVRDGSFIGARIDPAMPDRTPLPRSDLRLRHIAARPGRGVRRVQLPAGLLGRRRRHRLGSGRRLPGGRQGALRPSRHVASWSGGPCSARLPNAVCRRASSRCCSTPAAKIGQALVADPRIKAVGFTGSRAGGTALMKIAARARADPGLCRDELASIRSSCSRRAGGAGRGDRQGLRRPR